LGPFSGAFSIPLGTPGVTSGIAGSIASSLVNFCSAVATSQGFSRGHYQRERQEGVGNILHGLSSRE
jgi:hypothetical protein